MTEPDPNEMVDCPHSLSLLDGIGESFVIHKAPRSELAAHGNVCKKCFQAFSKRQGAAIKGRPQSPAEIHHLHRHDVTQDHVGFDESHDVVGVTDFDYAEVDRLLGVIDQEPRDVRQMVADALSKILVVCWMGAGDAPTTPQSAMQRFAALCSGLRPDITRRNFKEIAASLGVSKAATSKHAIRLEDLLGLKFSGSRSLESRQAMRRGQLRKNAAKKPMNTVATPPASKDSFENSVPQLGYRTP